VGYQTLFSNLSGQEIIAVGYQALLGNQIGFRNIAIGTSSLINNVIGQENTAIGYHSLFSNYSGNGNLAIGYESLYNNIDGDGNIAIGFNSLYNCSYESNNTAIGASAGRNLIHGDRNIFIGNGAGYNETRSYKLYIENTNADKNGALIYGEFDNNILRTNSQFQRGNPTGNGYAFPTTDSTTGHVLSTDGNGQISFTTLGVDPDWYEQGTSSAPNDIIDNIYTQGNVAIEGEAYISDKIGIGTGAENPDGYLEVRANNTATAPNIKLVDIGTSGARINFTNTGTTNGNVWTLFGDTNNTTTGNILTARGNGDVGIKGLPNTDFHIFHGNSGTSDGLKLQNSTDNIWWRFYVSSGSDDLRLYNSNNGTTVMGKFNDATGAYTATSDRRLKKGFKELYFSWDKFMQLKPLTYKYKKDHNPTNYIGMVAQDVEKTYPELVSYKEKEDIYHMDYSATGVVAIKAVQELKQEVNVVEEKIATISSENLKLKAQLLKYENIERRLSALEGKNKTDGFEISEDSRENK
jgi:hypothetical protein